MSHDDFLFTSGVPSVNNEALDYGIKRIPGVFPTAWLKNLQKFCIDSLDSWFALVPRENYAVIICGAEAGELAIAIPLRLRHGRDHVGRQNLAAGGPLLYEKLPAIEPVWHLLVVETRGKQNFAMIANREECRARIFEYWHNSNFGRPVSRSRITPAQLALLAAFMLAAFMLAAYFLRSGSSDGGEQTQLPPANQQGSPGGNNGQAVTWLWLRLQSPEFIAAVKEIIRQGWPEHDSRLAQLMAYFSQISEEWRKLPTKLSLQHWKQVRKRMLRCQLHCRDIAMLDANYRQSPVRIVLSTYAEIQQRLGLAASARDAKLYREISKRTE